MANISIRVDDNTKKQAEIICEQLGMNLTTATNIFLKQLVRTGGIPFEVKLDPFFSASNQAYLRDSIAEYEANQAKGVIKTMDELEEMGN